MTKIFTKKIFCYFCCVILFLTLIPSAGTKNADSENGVFYIISAQSTHSFSAYMPHSLSKAQTNDRCVWFKAAETDIGTEWCKESVDIRKLHMLSLRNKYSLPKSVFDNHLNYFKKEIYHLLI